MKDLEWIDGNEVWGNEVVQQFCLDQDMCNQLINTLKIYVSLNIKLIYETQQI